MQCNGWAFKTNFSSQKQRSRSLQQSMIKTLFVAKIWESFITWVYTIMIFDDFAKIGFA